HRKTALQIGGCGEDATAHEQTRERDQEAAVSAEPLKCQDEQQDRVDNERGTSGGNEENICQKKARQNDSRQGRPVPSLLHRADRVVAQPQSADNEFAALDDVILDRNTDDVRLARRADAEQSQGGGGPEPKCPGDCKERGAGNQVSAE